MASDKYPTCKCGATCGCFYLNDGTWMRLADAADGVVGEWDASDVGQIDGDPIDDLRAAADAAKGGA